MLDYLAGLRLDVDDLAWLNGCGRFTRDIVDPLARLHFTEDVDALPEDTVFFADEPILRISAPLREAQPVESRAMNLIHYETVVATKATFWRSTTLPPTPQKSRQSCASLPQRSMHTLDQHVGTWRPISPRTIE